MKKLLIFTLLIAFGIGSLLASTKKAPEQAEHYAIEIDAPQMKNNTVNLVMYFYGKMYAVDTIQLNDAGKGTFAKDKKLSEGMYAVYFPNITYFDLLISDDQDFKVAISDTANMVTNVNILNGEQSQAFQDYVKYVYNNRIEIGKLKENFDKIEDKTSAEALGIEKKINEIDMAVSTYQKNLAESYKGKALGVILKALIPVEVPEMEELPDSIRQISRYYYNRNHFFDNTDLSDQRLLYTNILSGKIDMFMDKMLVQNPDTIADQAVKLIEKTRGDTLTFQNMVTNMLNYALKSNMMGMDKMTMVISEKYYLSGEAKWADSTLLADLDREVRAVKYNQIGASAPNLFVETFDGKRISLSDIPQDYILIAFYEPGCGHCKKEMPKLYKEVYQKYKGDNFFEVFAFYIYEDKEEWKKFIDEHGLYDWVNVWDPKRESNHWYFYDVRTTPGMYLLNKERKIIAKKINLETLDMILESEKTSKSPKG
ncbi:MAG: TlpA family protein disulfide reductase [Bacteroidales bacterium]|jgi:peroxiredoxin|nr:TlpA family protein disulfide reductase [Bacteroidales bacterium]